MGRKTHESAPPPRKSTTRALYGRPPEAGRDGAARGVVEGCARFVTAKSGVERINSIARFRALRSPLALQTQSLVPEHESAYVSRARATAEQASVSHSRAAGRHDATYSCCYRPS